MEFDPFSAELRNGRILGRGTSDCKGGLSAGVIAINALMTFKKHLSGRIIYQSTVDEECNGGGAGTMACCLAGYKGDSAISLDGHDMIVTRGCNGCLTANVHVQGKAGHAAKAGAVSALEKALVVKRAIDGFKRARESRRPEARLNIGVFNAGVHPAVVPGSAFMSMNIVYELDEAARAEKRGRGWGAAEIRETFERIVRRADKKDPWLAGHPTAVEWVKDLMPFEVPADAEVVKDVSAAYKRVTGRPAKVDFLVAWTDVCYLPRCAQTPAVMCGAGVTGESHASDEYVTVSNLVAAAKVVALYLWRQLAVR
jgi:acetylornithine deacetylase